MKLTKTKLCPTNFAQQFQKHRDETTWRLTSPIAQKNPHKAPALWNMEDLPLRDLEPASFSGEKQKTNKLPEVAGDGLNRDFSKRNSWGKKWKTCIPRCVFSVVHFFFLIQMLPCMKYLYLQLPHFMVLMKVILHEAFGLSMLCKYSFVEQSSKPNQSHFLWSCKQDQTKRVNLVANQVNLAGSCHFVLPLQTQPPSVVQSWRFFGDFTSSFGKMKVWVGIPYKQM